MYRNSPNERATKPETKNGITGSEYKSATNEHANKATVRIKRLLPTIGKFNLGFKILPITRL